MNKERAREELTLMRDNLKMDLEETQATHWTDDKTTYDKRVELITDSIQALDIAIESLHHFNYQELFKQQKKATEKCLKTLTEIGEICKNNGWVDINDKLPSENELVLVTYNYKIKGEKENTTTVGTDILLQDGWRNHNNILAWKPLPKPYERKE